MTSSLVGSEMCIRDSGIVVSAQRALLKTNPPSIGKRECAAQALSRMKDCLLYTSDAADDM
eukprot:7887793-Prorocentrum_lima.AAC.1